MFGFSSSFIRGLALVSAATLLSGCATVMQPAKRVDKPAANHALINIVRPKVFFGDGIGVDVWHGERFLGVLGAGTMIQYEVPPGDHLFLGNAENWTYAKAKVEAGKQYFIKANLFPGVIMGRAAFGKLEQSDPRLSELMALEPVAVMPDKRDEYIVSKKESVRAAINQFETGKVSAFARIGPEDGR